MATVNFLYRSSKEKANLILRLLFRYQDNDYVFGASTKCEVTREYWTKQHKLKRVSEISIKNKQTEINNDLNKIENHILKAFAKVNPETITKNWLQLQIENYYNPPKKEKALPENIIHYIDFYIDYRKNEISEASRKKFNVIKHKLERFQAYRREPILIHGINDKFKTEFVNYLVKEGYSQNTMHRELVFIKTFCKHARFMGLETHPQLDGLSLERAKTEKIYLTEDEIELLNNIEPTKLSDSLANARDWLIISCYTGQRVSDFMRFKSNMIRYEDGKPLIDFTQVKTGKVMTLPLHRKVLEILEKRNGQFPYPISDQKYNDYIKLVAFEAGLKQKVKGGKAITTKTGNKVIGKSGKLVDESKTRKETGVYEKWELVSSHIGRRSFATNFYGKIPTSLLIAATGHSTEHQFLQYIGKSDSEKAKQLADYF
ncbi:tyrosine-type recombinase/integrase [Flavobacterium enshiense]|uniref:tyrosine-type recombinase/integrase n=1 Tax=Flavobacterium enshiense TaxID=1341165 RepID=UPI00345D607B